MTDPDQRRAPPDRPSKPSATARADPPGTPSAPSAAARADRPAPAVGAQVHRWRTTRGKTLAQVAAASGLNVGYLSQIENDKASPSLACLASIAAALEVPAAWFLMDDVPGPTVVRADERPVSRTAAGRVEHVDGRAARDISILEIHAEPGTRIGLHAHPGDEHHLVLRGRWRAIQGEHVVELGPGDYLRWDGAVPHDGEVIGDEPLAVLIMRIADRA